MRIRLIRRISRECAKCEGVCGRRSGGNTLEVRRVVWSYVWEDFLRRPLLGYGFDAYWTGDEMFVFQGINWTPRHAHNGFLEALLQMGLLGTVATLIHAMLVMRRGLVIGRQNLRIEGVWPLAYILMHLLFNFTYALFLGQNSLPWVLYVSVSLSTAAIMRSKSPLPTPSIRLNRNTPSPTI